MDLLLRHKTIRKFKDAEISKELLNGIIQSACRGASTTGNMQLYSIIVSRDKNQIQKLTPLHFNQPVAKSAPVLLTVCADFNRFTKWCEYREAEPGYDNLLSFLTASIDAIIVAQNICIAAEDKGLGICYLGTTTYNAKELINELNIPKLVFPITTLAIGWPDEDPEFTDRLPLEGIIHNEKYTDYNKQLIDQIYAFKEQLPESQKFIDENQKKTLAQVFTDVRYSKQDNILFSDKIIDVLKQQGFLSSERLD